MGIWTIIGRVFNGVGQVFFQENTVSGAFFLVALFISSRRTCGMALAGSFLGVLIAWVLGAAEPAIQSGAYGFNAVLTAIALGSALFRMNSVGVFYGMIGVVVTIVVSAGASAALEPLGMPALTLPFVLVVWVFLSASSMFPGLKSTSPTSTNE